jgi:hypothetical protein
MNLPAYFKAQAERCARLSRACFDLSVAEQLRAMADELRLKAAELERAYPPMTARDGVRRTSHG